MQLLKRRTKKGEGFDAVESDREFWYSATVAVVAGCDFDDEGGDGVAQRAVVAAGVVVAGEGVGEAERATEEEEAGAGGDDDPAHSSCHRLGRSRAATGGHAGWRELS